MYNDGIQRFKPSTFQGRNWLLEQLAMPTTKEVEKLPKQVTESKPLQSGNELWTGGGSDYNNQGNPSQSSYNNTPGEMVSPGGKGLGFDVSAGMKGGLLGGLAGGLPGALGGFARGLTLENRAPVYNAKEAQLTDLGRADAANQSLADILGSNFNPDNTPRGTPSNQDIENSIYGGGYDSGGWGDASGIGGSSVDSSYDGSGYNGYAKGGKVTKDRLFGPNPKGKDDGAAFLDVGEHVTKADASKYYGDKFMNAINEKRIPKSKAMGLLKGL
jgi:hypothetical protein